MDISYVKKKLIFPNQKIVHFLDDSNYKYLVNEFDPMTQTLKIQSFKSDFFCNDKRINVSKKMYIQFDKFPVKMSR